MILFPAWNFFFYILFDLYLQRVHSSDSFIFYTAFEDFGPLCSVIYVNALRTRPFFLLLQYVTVDIEKKSFTLPTKLVYFFIT